MQNTPMPEYAREKIREALLFVEKENKKADIEKIKRIIKKNANILFLLALLFLFFLVSYFAKTGDTHSPTIKKAIPQPMFAAPSFSTSPEIVFPKKSDGLSLETKSEFFVFGYPVWESKKWERENKPK